MGEMYLVEQDEGVLAEETGVDGSHRVADAVTAEKESGAYLIHGGCGDERLIGVVSPGVVSGHPTTKLRDGEWGLVSLLQSAQASETISDRNDHWVIGMKERLSNLLSSQIGLIHDGSAIDYHHDTQRGGAFDSGRRLECQLEEGDV